MIVLGIETSCDETAAAVITDQREILSSVVLSQLEEHAVFGGVVPEIAARAHLSSLDGIIQAALSDADVTLNDLDGVAATCGPGLIGGLLVGAVTGKALSSTMNIPFLAINHLEGHALTPRLTDNIAFPYLLLLVSGGHTQILAVEDVGKYKRWGTTLDDAAGECFDKCAKLLGLPFPGGPNLEKTAALCPDHTAARAKFPLPAPMKGRKNCDFSFSGLKTSVRNYVDKTIKHTEIEYLAYSFQETMADTIADRCLVAMTRFRENFNVATPTLVVAGGVSANKAIRTRLTQTASQCGMSLYAPPLSLCGDNAAMIAWAGIERLRLGLTDPLDFKARPRWPLDATAEPRLGAGVKA